MRLPEEIRLYINEILDQSKNGIVLSDPNQDDNPLIYVNEAFCKLFEYTFDEVIGLNCRFLQKDDKEQRGLKILKESIAKKEPQTVILRNYTKSGKIIYNEVTVSPIFDKDKNLKYFLGIQKDVTMEQKLLKQFKEIFQW